MYYNITNNSLIATINDIFPLNRVKINPTLYQGVQANDFPNCDLSDQNTATQFVQYLNWFAQDVEDNVDMNVIAFETGQLEMSFDGTANPSNPKEANGSVNINSIFDDGSKLSIKSYAAIGGPWGNGSPENGSYTAGNLRNRTVDGMTRGVRTNADF